MKKRMLAMLLALVLCFGLLATVAAADQVNTNDDQFNFSFDMFKKSFELPPVISQLLDMFHLNNAWNAVLRIINTIRGIDSMI